MNSRNGNADLEQQLRDVTKGIEADQQDAGTDVAVVEHPLDPNTAGENAAHAVHQCLIAAGHIRSMGEEFLAIAQSVKATGDALAADLEGRAKHFDDMMSAAREYAKQTQDIFAQERQRMSGLKLPSV